MRHLLALGAVAVWAGAAPAQTGTVSGGVTTTKLGGGGSPAAMPGQVVGSGISTTGSAPQPVGTKFPTVGDTVGRPYDPTRPLDVFRGTGINPKSVIAPVTAFPPAPTLDKNLIDRLYDKLDAALSFKLVRTPEPLAAPMNVTPGIFRRNRERAEERMWRRD